MHVPAQQLPIHARLGPRAKTSGHIAAKAKFGIDRCDPPKIGNANDDG